jgi:outer membrane protein OmpU
MKKLLLTSVAVSGLALAATPARAEIELEVGGYFKGYMAWVDQDEEPGSELNDIDMVRDTEIHVGGETTLDNGLTVGAHFEIDADGGDGGASGTDTDADGDLDTFSGGDSLIDESYIYFSGDWGRVNVGAEDGAAYLLQVAAPSADSNYDGIRQFVNPFNQSVAGLSTSDVAVDYAADPSGKSDKLTYLSPVFNGFQAGVTFSPDTDFADDLEGIGTDDVAGEIGRTYEIAARYEGEFNNIGLILGAGYSYGELEDEDTSDDDDREVWNVGLDLDVGPVGVGAAYVSDNNATDDNDTDTIVVGLDYTTGPFKIGASYLNSDTDETIEIDRYSGGVNYEYGPGMSFRGTLSYLDAEEDGGDDADGVALLVGTQVEF